MQKKLNIITVQPDSAMFQWTVAVQLFNAKQLGILEYFQVLVYKSYEEKEFNSRWKFLEKKFPEAKFFYYADTENVTKVIQAFDYIPLLRPWTLKQHWKAFPNLKDEAIFYIDSDVVFSKYPDFLFKYKDDDINYASRPSSDYVNASYFDSKYKDVVLEVAYEYKNIDVLDKAAKLCGVNRQICENNNFKTGAAQYLLKNVDADFWQLIFDGSVKVKTYLADINKRFFPSEEAGFQSWCADIWAMMWTLWSKNLQVETPDEFNFSWASNYIEEWYNNYIYHDASAPDGSFKKDGKDLRCFFKRGNRIKIGPVEVHDYTLHYEAPMLKTPFDDDLSYVSPELCSYNYVQIIKDTKNYLYN